MSISVAAQVCAAVFTSVLVATFPCAPLLAQLQGSEGSTLPVVLHGREFASDPKLVATREQRLAYEADSLSVAGRFQLEAGSHQFCVEGAGTYFRGLKLIASNGEYLAVALDAAGCGRAQLPSGVVSVQLAHGAGPKPPSWTTATLRVDAPIPPVTPVPLVDGNNSPAAGYWAIQDNNFNARGTFGNRLLSSAPQAGNSQTPSVQYVDPSTSFDGMSLWQLPSGSGEYLPALLNSGGPNLWSLYFLQIYVVTSCGFYCGNAYDSPPGLEIKDLGNYQFQFLLHPDLSDPGSLYGESNNGRITLNGTFAAGGGDTFQVLFRFFPQGPPVGTLQPGEVALYQGCDYQGKTSVFIPLLGAGVVSPPYDLSKLTSADTTLDGTAKAIDIGNGSSIYWGANASSPDGAVVSLTSCLNASPKGNLYVEPLSNTLVVAHNLLNHSCVSCSLGGQTLNLTPGSAVADFSQWNFSQADFSHSSLSNLDLSRATLTSAKFVGATLNNVNLSGMQTNGTVVDFSGATLTNVTFSGVDLTKFKFIGATLNNINLGRTVASGSGLDFTNAILNQVNLSGVNAVGSTFSGATLCGVSLTGTDQNHVLDLTSGNFAGVHVTLSSACAADLSYTVLAASPTVGAQWTGLNLTGTVVTGLQGQVLSTQTAPLDLSGTTLVGSSLQGVGLDYAKFAKNQDLTGINLNNSSIRFTNLQGAKLFGASFQSANLEGAVMNGAFLTALPAQNLSAATMQGSFMRDVNLSQAQLSGANFTNANFYSQVAVGTGACTPDPNTGFTSGCATAASATMDGTEFGNAYLFGVDFRNATAEGVNFGNAILVGANFSGATLSASQTDTGFSGAFLQGTNMSGVVLQNRLSLQNAFVDFSPTATGTGNIINLKLGAQNTTFAGYWNTPGEGVCAQMSYSGPTAVPTTSILVTCPNSFQVQGGCGAAAAAKPLNENWRSKADITTVASYVNDATYTSAPTSGTQICNADIKWVPLSLDHPGPDPGSPRPPHKPKKPKHPTPGKPHGRDDDPKHDRSQRE